MATKKIEITVPNGQILSAELKDGICKLVISELEEQKVASEFKETKSEHVSEIKKREAASVEKNFNDLLFRVEASKLSMEDKFLDVVEEVAGRQFYNDLIDVIQNGISDFYVVRMNPSFDENGNICFKEKMPIAEGKSYNWWLENAKKFKPELNSRLGKKSEYIAYIGVFLKTVIADNINDMNTIWKARLQCRIQVGASIADIFKQFELKPAGHDSWFGFCDIRNAHKFLSADVDENVFWTAHGSFLSDYTKGTRFPIGNSIVEDIKLGGCTGWMVFKK